MTRPYSKQVCFEPRVMWDQFRIRPTSVAPVELETDQRNWYNGSPFPFVIQHMILSPVGYTLQRYASPPTQTAATYRNAMGAALQVEARITAPGRKHFSRRTVPVGGYRPRPVSVASVPAPGSTLLGLSRWDFDFPNDEGVVLPKLATIAFQVSGYTFPNVGLTTPTATQQRARAHVVFYERTDTFWKRSARWSGPLNIQPKVPLAGQPAHGFYPVTPAPVPDDGFGFAAAANAPQKNLTFDAAGTYLARRFMQEEKNLGSDYDRFCGVGVMLDQIDLDAIMQQADVGTGVAGSPLAPLAQRVALKASVSSGGSGQDWFDRGGAPVSLCCPTINEVGVVHTFDRPITLDPNAGLRVDLRTPGGLPGSELAFFPGIYNIGVSFVGYSIIEGTP